MKKPERPVPTPGESARYEAVFGEVSSIIEAARRSAARSANAVMTAACWLTGRHVGELEQEGSAHADYGKETVERLAADLSARYGRGFSVRSVWLMRAFYLAWPKVLRPTEGSGGGRILQTPSAESRWTPSAPGFRCRGPPTCGCSRCRTSAPRSSMWPRPCAGAGRSASLTARSTPSSKSGSRCQGTRPP